MPCPSLVRHARIQILTLSAPSCVSHILLQLQEQLEQALKRNSELAERLMEAAFMSGSGAPGTRMALFHCSYSFDDNQECHESLTSTLVNKPIVSCPNTFHCRGS